MTAENASIDDLFVICKNGGVDILWQFFNGRDNAGNFLSLSDNNETVVLFGKECWTWKWNPFLFAVYYGHVDTVKFFLEELNVNVMFALEIWKEKYEVERDDLNL
mgnify:CR=1 FL=1